MHAPSEGPFTDLTLEDDKSTSMETKPPEQENVERHAAEKETNRANTALRSNRTLLALVITVCIISFTVLLLTILMLSGKIGARCGCSTDKGTIDIERNKQHV